MKKVMKQVFADIGEWKPPASCNYDKCIMRHKYFHMFLCQISRSLKMIKAACRGSSLTGNNVSSREILVIVRLKVQLKSMIKIITNPINCQDLLPHHSKRKTVLRYSKSGVSTRAVAGRLISILNNANIPESSCNTPWCMVTYPLAQRAQYRDFQSTSRQRTTIMSLSMTPTSKHQLQRPTSSLCTLLLENLTVMMSNGLLFILLARLAIPDRTIPFCLLPGLK
jgi:hypothetical protein